MQAKQDRPAYRLLDQSVSLDQVLGFKYRWKVSKDNTIKRRTLHLLTAVVSIPA